MKPGLDFTYCKCNPDDLSAWPTIKMQIGDSKNRMWVYMKPEEYVMVNRGNECLLGIVEELAVLEGEYTVILGDPFLRAYLTIYNTINAIKKGTIHRVGCIVCVHIFLCARDSVPGNSILVHSSLGTMKSIYDDTRT